MPKIEITELDLTSPGRIVQDNEIVYIPGLVNTKNTNLWVDGEYVGLKPFQPTLFTSVSDFEYKVGRYGVQFEKDQYYSDLYQISDGFDDSDIPYHNTMFKKGDTDPSYVMAKELLASGLSIVYERINEDTSLVHVDYEPSDFSTTKQNYREKTDDAYKAFDKPVQYFKIALNPVVGNTYYTSTVNDGVTTFTAVEIESAESINPGVTYYTKLNKNTIIYKINKFISESVATKGTEIIGSAELNTDKDFGLLFTREDIDSIQEVNGTECLIVNNGGKKVAISQLIINKLCLIPASADATNMPYYRYTPVTVDGYNLVVQQPSPTTDYYIRDDGFSFVSYTKVDGTTPYTVDELKAMGTLYTINSEGLYEKINITNTVVNSKKPPLFKQQGDSFLPLIDPDGTLVWSLIKNASVRNIYTYDETTGSYVETFTSTQIEEKTDTDLVYSGNDEYIYFVNSTNYIQSNNSANNAKLRKYIPGAVYSKQQVLQETGNYTYMAKGYEFTETNTTPSGDMYFKNEYNVLVPYTGEYSQTLDFDIYTIDAEYNVNVDNKLPSDYNDNYSRYFEQTESYVVPVEFNDNIYTFDDHCNIKSIYTALPQVFSTEGDLTDRGNFNVKYITSGGYPTYGFNGGSICSAMINFCNARGDCYCFLDPTDNPDRPQNLTNSNNLYNRVSNDTSIASNYATMIVPHLEYVRTTTDKNDEGKLVPGKNLRLAASYGYLQALADSITVNAPWLAIAGATRGIVPNISSKSDSNISNKVADDMQPRDGVSINSITNIKPYGQILWGNRTLATNSAGNLTALSFLNIRNLVCDVKKICYTAAKFLTFEQNNEILWLNFKSRITPTLDKMLSGYGISDYRIERDTTREEALEKATVCARITLYPVYAVEDFYIDIILSDEEVTTEE